jgi:hypothetical protein
MFQSVLSGEVFRKLMEVGKIEFEQPSETAAKRFIEKYGNEAWAFGTVDTGGNFYPHQSPKPKMTFLAWECPACGVGVRGDIEVCPNCVKQKQGAQPDKLNWKGYGQLFSNAPTADAKPDKTEIKE